MRTKLDLLDEKRERAQVRNVCYQAKVTRTYNKKVRMRTFQPGQLVLRQVFQNKKISGDGKLGPHWEGPYRIITISGNGAYRLAEMDGGSRTLSMECHSPKSILWVNSKHCNHAQLVKISF